MASHERDALVSNGPSVSFKLRPVKKAPVAAPPPPPESVRAFKLRPVKYGPIASSVSDEIPTVAGAPPVPVPVSAPAGGTHGCCTWERAFRVIKIVAFVLVALWTVGMITLCVLYFSVRDECGWHVVGNATTTPTADRARCDLFGRLLFGLECMAFTPAIVLILAFFLVWA